MGARRIWRGRVLGSLLFDGSSFMDRGLNIRSSISYLRDVHDAAVPYLADGASGGEKGVTEGACGCCGLATDGHRLVTDYTSPPR